MTSRLLRGSPLWSSLMPRVFRWLFSSLTRGGKPPPGRRFFQALWWWSQGRVVGLQKLPPPRPMTACWNLQRCRCLGLQRLWWRLQSLRSGLCRRGLMRSRSMPPMDTCSTSFCPRCLITAPITTAGVWRTGCASPWRSWSPFELLFQKACRCLFVFLPRTGLRMAGHWRNPLRYPRRWRHSVLT